MKNFDYFSIIYMNKILPTEIQEYIFSFNVGYTDIYKYLIYKNYNDNCIYKNNKVYLICKNDKKEIILTNCLINPYYVSINYFKNDYEYHKFLNNFNDLNLL